MQESVAALGGASTISALLSQLDPEMGRSQYLEYFLYGVALLTNSETATYYLHREDERNEIVSQVRLSQSTYSGAPERFAAKVVNVLEGESERTCICVERPLFNYDRQDGDYLETVAACLRLQEMNWRLKSQLESAIGQRLVARREAAKRTGEAEQWEARYRTLEKYVQGLVESTVSATAAMERGVRDLDQFWKPTESAGMRAKNSLTSALRRHCAVGAALEGQLKLQTRKSERNPLALPGLLASCCRRLSQEFSKRLQLERDRLPTLLGDELEWTSLFWHLLRNSLQYGGERVVVRIECVEEVDHFHFIVCDDGPGLSPERARQAFLPFKRFHGQSEVPGIGLGLYVCEQTVNRWGGAIWISTEGNGSGLTVHFTYPKDITRKG